MVPAAVSGDTSWYPGGVTKPVSPDSRHAWAHTTSPAPQPATRCASIGPIPKGEAHERGQAFPGPARGGDRAAARVGRRAERRAAARALVAAGVDPRARG